MEKQIILALATIFFVFSVSGAVEPSLTAEKVEPNPAQPGETVKVFLTVTNDGTSKGTFETVDVETVRGINFTGTTSNLAGDFTLCGGCQTTGTLYFRVSPEATSGTYPVDIEVSTGDTGVVEKAEIEVDGTPKLVASSSGFGVAPGEKTAFNLSITNIGTDTASETTVSSASSELSLQPSSPVFGSIGPGEKVTRLVEIRADSEASSGLKNLELDAEYRDDNQERLRALKVTGEVLEQAEIAISDLETSGASKGSVSDVTVQLENLGPGEATRITAEITCENADVESGKSFVGQLGDDESVPATFTIVPRSETVSCELGVSYSDSKERTATENFSFSAEDSSPPVLPALLVLVLAAGGVYYWRRRRNDELEEV